jgi:hypothetical protein
MYCGLHFPFRRTYYYQFPALLDSVVFLIEKFKTILHTGGQTKNIHLN